MNVIAVKTAENIIDSWSAEVTNAFDDLLENRESDALGKTAEVTINGYEDYDGLLADKALSVTVKNISDSTLSFSISIEALDASGNRIDESYVSAQDLAPGQSYTDYAFAYSSLDEDVLENATFRVYKATSY